ncbi:GPP34 family phosphoprotein [Micromonospora tulbaghiae]|uniref:GOLPH3/VPS74 family protein n=1 Tax=Micromonospora tulbaghiae TaxID=479978 RepID=UPI0033344088
MGPPENALLADEFFLIAHDDQYGRPRLHGVAIRFGLAAALLGELAIARHINFAQGNVYVYDSRPPTDWLQHRALSQIIAEPQQRATRTWLTYLAATSYENVGQRLVETGVVEIQERRRFFGLAASTPLYVPRDMNRAAWSWARLSQRLRNSEQLDSFDLILAGIAEATGLDRFILDGAPYATGAFLRSLLAAAPESMHDLLADLRTSIGAASLNPRA